MDHNSENNELKDDVDGKEEEKPSFSILDKRHWVTDKNDEGVADTGRKKLPTYLEELESQLNEKECKLNEFMERTERENSEFRERMNREIERRVEKFRIDLILKFLPVIDNLERALASTEEQTPETNFIDGVKMVYSQFFSELEKEGVEYLEVISRPFDPQSSEALGLVSTDDPELNDIVADELEKGYTIDGKLLRPAKVRVHKHSS